MKRTALTLALCVLTAGAAAGQMSSIDVPAAGRTVALAVQIVPASGEKVAHAAAMHEAEPDGVMVLPMPGSGYMLRTEKFKGSGDITTMVSKDAPKANALFAESMCTSRWMSGGTAHCLVSTMASGEDMAAWSQRHQEALMMITAVYAPTNAAPAPMQGMPDMSGNRDVAKTPWTDATGDQNEVSTKRHDGEAREAWLARHRMAVMAFAAAMQPKA